MARSSKAKVLWILVGVVLTLLIFFREQVTMGVSDLFYGLVESYEVMALPAGGLEYDGPDAEKIAVFYAKEDITPGQIIGEKQLDSREKLVRQTYLAYPQTMPDAQDIIGATATKFIPRGWRFSYGTKHSAAAGNLQKRAVREYESDFVVDPRCSGRYLNPGEKPTYKP